VWGDKTNKKKLESKRLISKGLFHKNIKFRGVLNIGGGGKTSFCPAYLHI
jgi:hypothetical protein